MSRENGESHGLWPDDDQVVPLVVPQRTVAPSPNGDRAASALDEDASLGPIRLTAGEFTTERMLRPTPDVPSGGWRRVALLALRRTGRDRTERGRAAPARARREGQDADRRLPQDRLHLAQGRRRQDERPACSSGTRSRRTAATASSPSTAIPDAGTLGHRVRRETTANLTSLLADADQDRAVRRHPRLHVAGADAGSRSSRRTTIRGSRRRSARASSSERSDFSSATTTSSASTPAPACSSRRRAGSSTPPIRSSSSARRASTARARRARRSTGSTQNGYERPRPRRGRRAQRRAPGQRRRRPRPDRGALRQRVPRLRPHPVGSASRSRRRGDRRRASAATRSAPTSSSPPRSPPASPNRPKGGHSHDRSSRTSSSPRRGIGGDAGPERPARQRRAQQLVSGLAFWALLAALGGLLISAAVWALSSHSGQLPPLGARSARDGRSPRSRRSSSARRRRSSPSSRTSATTVQ